MRTESRLHRYTFIANISFLSLRSHTPGGADWRVCPFEPNRVWYSIKYTGSNDGEVFGRPATFKTIDSPVQAHSLTFNERGEVTKFTIGYVLDKETGNTGGLGGVFGLFCTRTAARTSGGVAARLTLN